MTIKMGYYNFSDNSVNIKDVTDPEFIKAYQAWMSKPEGRQRGMGFDYKGKTYSSGAVYKNPIGGDNWSDIRSVSFSDDDGGILDQGLSAISDVLNSDVGKLATNIAASYYGGPLGVGALNLAQGNSLEDSAKAAAISYAAQQASSASDPNAVGGVTGPDNIDVGGGFNPGAGATAAELEAARLALEAPTNISGYDAAMVDLANAPPAFDGSQITPEQITSDIASTQPTPTGDNIDAGGGWSPATGATEAELAQARAAMASTGWTMSQALNAVRAGLLVNAITGDPLGLGGGQPEQTAPKGFDIVPIPSDWKSPTYTNTPVQNVSFEDLFPGVSLQGTQWARLQNQQPNMSFNDIFAAGQQQTPMGMPVNIQDIVGSILGQSAKS